MQDVQNLLNHITQELKALETAKILYSEQLAPSFRVFNYIKTDELGISKIIADLLNPHGSHAQKSLFLDKFMQVCLPKLVETTDWQNFSHDEVTVNMEESTKNGRRMDIYLSNGSHVICIENKPYADDQKNQLLDYAKELSKHYQDNYHLIYLDERSEPSDYSVDQKTYQQWQDENKVTWLKFSELIPWLTACKADCQNDSVVEFINQFIKFIQVEFMGVQNMNEEELITKSLLENFELTEKIATSIGVIKEKHLNHPVKELGGIIDEKKWINITKSDYGTRDKLYLESCLYFEFPLNGLPVVIDVYKNIEVWKIFIFLRSGNQAKLEPYIQNIGYQTLLKDNKFCLKPISVKDTSFGKLKDMIETILEQLIRQRV